MAPHASHSADCWSPSPARIVVFRALQLGDLLCVVPALRALRARAPRADITLVGLPWASAFARRFCGLVDRFVDFPGACGLPERVPDHAAFPGFIAAVRDSRFDVAVQMHGSGALTNLLVGDFNARHTIAHVPPGSATPPGMREWCDGETEILRYVNLLDAAGAPSRGVELEFPITEEDRAELAALRVAAAFDPAACVCIHPGARLSSRRWGTTRFAEVGDALAHFGWRVVLTGARDEAALTAAVAAQMHYPAIDLAGRTSLGGLAALIASCRLVVANDTGISHVAAAVHTPSVIVSSGGDARRWAPLNSERHRVLHADTPCRPCAHQDCPYAGHPCAQGVSVERVIEDAGHLLCAGVLHVA